MSKKSIWQQDEEKGRTIKKEERELLEKKVKDKY